MTVGAFPEKNKFEMGKKFIAIFFLGGKINDFF